MQQEALAMLYPDALIGLNQAENEGQASTHQQTKEVNSQGGAE